MATRPHSEHSFSAMSSLLRMVEVMVNRAGSEEDVEGCDEAAMWMSERAVTVLATTYVRMHVLNAGRQDVGVGESVWSEAHHGVAVGDHVVQLVQEAVFQD